MHLCFYYHSRKIQTRSEDRSQNAHVKKKLKSTPQFDLSFIKKIYENLSNKSAPQQIHAD